MSFPRLNLAFITYRFGHQYGSAEAYGVELMRELAKRHDITVIGRSYDPDCDLRLPFIPITLSELWPSWIRTYLFAKEVDRLIKKEQYDLVHSHINGWSGALDILHVKSVRYSRFIKTHSWWKKFFSMLSPRIHMYLWLEKQRVHIKPPRRTAVVSESLKQQLHKQLKKSDLLNRIVFINQSATISSYYQAADIALHPTFNDSFGMAPLEAMAYELPVIMSDEKWCGFTKYTMHKKNAYLLQDPHNATELSLAINEVMTNSKLKLQLKQQGYELATEFTWDNIAKQVESIYVDMIATRLHKASK